MTYGELKERLEKPSLFHDIMILAQDPTLGETRKDQMEGLLFSVITGQIWCEVEDSDEI